MLTLFFFFFVHFTRPPPNQYQGYLRAGKCYVKLGDFVRAKMQYEKGTCMCESGVGARCAEIIRGMTVLLLPSSPHVGWLPLSIPAMGLEPNNADAKKEVQRGLPFSFYPLVLSLSGHLCLPTHAGVCLSVVASPSIIPPPAASLGHEGAGRNRPGQTVAGPGQVHGSRQSIRSSPRRG